MTQQLISSICILGMYIRNVFIKYSLLPSIQKDNELQSICIELNKAYDTLEVKNEDYLVFCDSDDEAIEKGNKVMGAAFRNRGQISLVISRMADERRKILSVKREQAS